MYISILLLLVIITTIKSDDIIPYLIAIFMIFYMGINLMLSYEVFEYDNVGYTLGNSEEYLDVDLNYIRERVKHNKNFELPIKTEIENGLFKYNKVFIPSKDVYFQKGDRDKLIIETYYSNHLGRLYLYRFEYKKYIAVYSE